MNSRHKVNEKFIQSLNLIQPLFQYNTAKTNPLNPAPFLPRPSIHSLIIWIALKLFGDLGELRDFRSLRVAMPIARHGLVLLRHEV